MPAVRRYTAALRLPAAVWDLSPSGLFSVDPDDRGGRSILEVLNATFRAAYDGNRAPVPIFVHSSFFTPEGLNAMQRFAGEAPRQGGLVAQSWDRMGAAQSWAPETPRAPCLLMCADGSQQQSR